MTKERARELRAEAWSFRNDGELCMAGDLHTACAHEFAACTRRTFPDPGYLESALGHLLDAATCYRIAGEPFRTGNRCELGEVLAADRFEYVSQLDVDESSFENLRRGAWPEFVGDLRTVAERSDAADAYDRALSIYESAGEWELVMSEQEHLRLLAYYRSLKRGLDIDVPEDAPEAPSLGVTFTEWVAYKRETLPDLLDSLELQGTWPRPDHTYKYDR